MCFRKWSASLCTTLPHRGLTRWMCLVCFPLPFGMFFFSWMLDLWCSHIDGSVMWCQCLWHEHQTMPLHVCLPEYTLMPRASLIVLDHLKLWWQFIHYGLLDDLGPHLTGQIPNALIVVWYNDAVPFLQPKACWRIQSPHNHHISLADNVADGTELGHRSTALESYQSGSFEVAGPSTS